MTTAKSPVSHQGFLSPDLAALIPKIRQKEIAWFDLANRLSDLGMAVLHAAQPSTSNESHLITALLYGRALTSFQSAYILTERGLLADARTVIRAAVETVIVLNALAADAEILDLLIKRHKLHHRKLLNSWLADSQATAQMSQAQKAQFENLVRALDDSDSSLSKASDPVVIANLAAKTGLLSLYNAVYRTTSGDSAHTSLDALDRHVKSDGDSAITGLKFGPETKDIADTLSVAISTLAPAVNVIIRIFGLDTYQVTLDKIVTDWTALGVPATSDQVVNPAGLRR